MRLLTILIILVFYNTLVFSTGQAGDIIIWNNKKYVLFSNPLESYPQFNSMRSKLFGGQKGDWNTGCYRGYIAEWELINDQLYLTNIFSCTDLTIRANLYMLFPGQVSDGKIIARWVNEILIVPEGKCLYYGNLGYLSIYETEYELTIKNGELTDKKKFENSVHISVFNQKPDSLVKFIHSSIQWDKFPDIKIPLRVLLMLATTDINKPEVKIVRGSGIKEYDDEAVRAASQLPDWDFYMQRGKVFRQTWAVQVTFSNENKKKYSH